MRFGVLHRQSGSAEARGSKAAGVMSGFGDLDIRTPALRCKSMTAQEFPAVPGLQVLRTHVSSF
jgi:hypothetical protein